MGLPRLLATSYLTVMAVGRKSSNENRLAASNPYSFYPVRREGEVSGVFFAKVLRVVGSPSYSQYALLGCQALFSLVEPIQDTSMATSKNKDTAIR
jgi:hypothetical protein